jgi:hypothetical protein
VLVLALAAWRGLEMLLTERLRVTPKANAKILALIAGMVAGADSISDMVELRHGGVRSVGYSSTCAPQYWAHSCACPPSGMPASSTPSR